MRTTDFYNLAQWGERRWAVALAKIRKPAPLRASAQRTIVLSLALLASTAILASAQDQKHPADLTQMNLEDLMQLEVSSVSKKEQPLLEAPAAVYVITQEDIRRSGATSIPEALRMVPGLQVARISANQWAISARGFNQEFANKLL